jgi:hypothetical protein
MGPEVFTRKVSRPKGQLDTWKRCSWIVLDNGMYGMQKILNKKGAHDNRHFTYDERGLNSKFRYRTVGD